MSRAALRDIPEVAGLDARAGLVRIPPELDVPLTPRVRQILDTADFRRLSRISQLGLVGLVYPAANHSRLEHSLGVYRLALLTVRRMAEDERFAATVSADDAVRFLLAALLHDLGHWPFCHPIEDMHLPGVPTHELFANSFILEGEIADAIRDEWRVQPREVVTLLSGEPATKACRLLASILAGPIDIDKMDYLMRDSLHAGVPYGRNYDQSRLVRHLCLNAEGDGLAITEKGKTAAEMLVFARYVMFSEVYWHHAVRSSTAMLQRAFFLLYPQLDLDSLFRQTEEQLVRRLLRSAKGQPAAELLDGLFGTTRRLYKRLAEYTHADRQELYDRLSGKTYSFLAACAERMADFASAALQSPVAAHEVLIDAPPARREVQPNLPVYCEKRDRYRMLGDISPVVRALAREQFDNCVKKVRVFVHPRLSGTLRGWTELDRWLTRAIDETP
jgi:HD superfamily phosphohydrolase